MSRKMLVLLTLVLSLTVMPLTAETLELPLPDAPTGCNQELIDLADPEISAKLQRGELTLLGNPSIRYVSKNTKISTGGYSYYDDEGNQVFAEVTCRFTCNGQSCTQSGCEPSGNGCSSWSCGSGCTGSCTQTSSGGGGEPSPEQPTNQ